MISKKLTIALFFSMPIFWVLFILTPKYLLPSECFLDNFIYAENLIRDHFYHYDKFSTYNFDDSANILYIFILSLISTFFKIEVYKASIYLNAISLLFSFFALVRIINSRFSNVNFFLMIALLLSTQIWASLLGSDVLFLGFLYLLVLSSFWHKKYTFMLIWSSILIAINLQNLYFVLPLILSSYIDILEYKKREYRKFYTIRLGKTFIYLILPVIIFYAYRLIYFGKILPYHQIATESNHEKILFFDKSAFYFCVHYLRYFVLPLIIGIVFYLIKQRKKIGIKYYAVILGYIILPFIFTSLKPQTENIAYQNYYIIYLGLIVITFLFIRDFRSISQKITLGVFILFYAIPQFITYGINSLQQYNNNVFRIAKDLESVNKAKMIAYDDNFISYTTDFQTIFANGKHTRKKDRIINSIEEIQEIKPDIVLYENLNVNSKWYGKYDIFEIPRNTKQYIKELKPENSIDYLYYYFREKYNVKNFKYVIILVAKKSTYNKEIKDILKKHGGKEKI
jgi:hypothetical protein